MAFVAGYSFSEAQLLLALSSLAYEDPRPLPGETVAAQQLRMQRDIDGALAAPRFADWSVAWGPALDDDRSNMMYAAGSPSLNQYAVVIRGTDWAHIEDWLQDVGAVLGLEAFPFPIAAKAAGTERIARGTLLGLQSLIGMRVDPNDATTDLATFVGAKLVEGADVFVTGHSLGGCLASVVAPWLASLQGGADHLKVYTFAAPSAGNRDFATYYNNLFVDAGGQSTAYRVYNKLDVVPNAWASLPLIANYYQPAPLCTLEIRVLVATAALAVGAAYAQVGDAGQPSAVELQGMVVPAAAAALSVFDDAAFLNQIDQQHAPSTYLRLLQAPT